MHNKEAVKPSYFQYWGKAKKQPDGNGPDFHLLPYHCLDVAAVADVWLKQSPTLLKQIAKHLGVESSDARKMVLFFILLHDLGKFDVRFQNFREDIRVKLQGDEYEVDPDPVMYSHGSCGYIQFREVYGPNEAMKAVAGHHGFCDTSIDYFPPDADEELIQLDEHARCEWIHFCLAFCGLDEIPQAGEIPLLAGLCSVADWVGSSITNFTVNNKNDLRDYYQQALPRAEEALIATGMIEHIQGGGFEFLFPEYQPRGIQKLLKDLPLKAGLTIVEADTGAGKTEFALAYASALIKAGLADGIVFGLPTQATANGLYDRVGEAAQLLFPDTNPTLAHGKSRYLLADMSDETGFLQQSNKRAFLGSVSVATIDQILMGVLGVKHQFIRSFGTRKSVLILDEIHSFDPYMMGLIEQVIKGQHQAYASVLLLSATLPSHLKDNLLACYQGHSNCSDYPLITHTSLQGETVEFKLSSEPEIQSKKEVLTELWNVKDCLPTDQNMTDVAEWVIQGAMVAVICNTVADAQKFYLKIKDLYPELLIDLFHARYTFSDRARIESQVLSSYGKHAERQGRLLIATQVVEQSLDLDFDIIISQIAPIEYLFQRMGRLWRHDRINTELNPRSKAIEQPLFITLVPEQDISPDAEINSIKSHYSGSGYVYKNIRWLYRTQNFFRQNANLQFPDCYRAAIEYVHGLDALENEPIALTAIAESHEIKGQGSHYTARQISAMQSRPLNDVDPRCALLTREGEMSVSVVLFNEHGALFHGGDFDEQQDRELNLISLAPKYAKGKKCDKYFCYQAIVGKDIHYTELGFLRNDLAEELMTGR